MRFAGSVLSHGILDEWCENVKYSIYKGVSLMKPFERSTKWFQNKLELYDK